MKKIKIKNLDEKNIKNIKETKILELKEMKLQDLKVLKVKIEIDNKEKEWELYNSFINKKEQIFSLPLGV